MARFKWLGEPAREGLTYGETTRFDVPTKTGTQTLLPVSPATYFVIGQDIGHDITCPLCITALNADPRFELIP